MDRRVHYFGERVHGRKVVLLGKGMEMVYMEVVVLCMFHMVVGVVDKD